MISKIANILKEFWIFPIIGHREPAYRGADCGGGYGKS
jgi:hypothetical protein